LHLGHLVVFNKLKQFQDLDHETTLLIGDYSTTIEDRSGRSAERTILSNEQIEDNYKTYVDQAFKVRSLDKTIIRKNSEWFNNMYFGDTVLLARQTTVSQMLEREDFDNRHKNKSPISIVKFLYPLRQGYDFIMLDADVKIGDRTSCLVYWLAIPYKRTLGKKNK
jgi:tyrosyl-tRNA synthetase